MICFLIFVKIFFQSFVISSFYFATLLVTSSCEQLLHPNAIALGNFDGIHQGHQQVLQSIFEPNSLISNSLTNKIYPTIVTFNPHPKEFFTGQKIKLLTPLNEKVILLEKLGLAQLLLLPFDSNIASLTPQEFVEEILIKKIKPCLISVGEDFRFGHQRKGNAEDLKEIASSQGIKVVITTEKTLNIGEQKSPRISSSHIRQALSKGNIEVANKMLGRKYSLTGKIIEGQKLGRTIGFPTANLAISAEKFLPKKGVYAVQVYLENEREIKLKGVMNIGCRPTVDGNNISTEVHLLNWTGNLYNKVLTVELEKFLRPEEKFTSLDALKTQITKDCEVANLVF